MTFSRNYFEEVSQIASMINENKIEDIVNVLVTTRDIHEGRVFVIGVGGSAGNASHMVNDLRKLCGIETYAPTDNASEITARTNDEGFDTIFEEYLKVSRFCYRDTLFVLSVGGGDEDRNVSVGIIKAIKYAINTDGNIVGVVGKPDGYTATTCENVVVVPVIESSRITPHSEAFQAVVWHCIVSHPKLQINKTKW